MPVRHWDKQIHSAGGVQQLLIDRARRVKIDLDHQLMRLDGEQFENGAGESRAVLSDERRAL